MYSIKYKINIFHKNIKFYTQKKVIIPVGMQYLEFYLRKIKIKIEINN